ncbi:receptor-type tyrosine-protein phosphatase [Achlya hypogyna]|uniref:Receptor-type tyrosine-protein phosphatase n=1 Tax=Achlya hypogyna TaxID=1202772 RepID=A0A1V9ZP09_ACHHY|nr:receptor-type tyrosine-protein phosphatase [Achlya hypogyna]
MWWKKKASGVEAELRGAMDAWWQPLSAALASGDLQRQASVQAFVARCDAMTPRDFKREYLEIRAAIDGSDWYEAALTVQTTATSKKNRYTDVLPFEKTRVRLQAHAADAAGDYINANFVDDGKYIACCAPPPSAIADFWSMIWHENVHVILMLTNFVERQMLKADWYWDPQGSVVRIGDLSVRLASETESALGYTTRAFELTHIPSAATRTVHHVQLTTWPDHGVLTDFSVIEPMLHLVNALNTPTPSPIVVHCSAGIGRSGTFIAIDMILKQLRAAVVASSDMAPALDVQAIVQRIRTDRPGMVQTAEQYEMIHRYLRHVLT